MNRIKVPTLNLSTKGKILVGIPLVMQVVSVIVLFWMLGNANQQTTKAEQSKQVMLDSLAMTRKLYETENALYEYLEQVRHDAAHKSSQKYSQLAATIPGQLQRLETLAQGSPAREKLIGRLVKEVKRLERIMDAVKKALENEDLSTVFTLGVIMQTGHGPLNKISDILEELTLLEQPNQQLERDAKLVRQKVQSLLIGSVAFNAIVVLLLLRVFHQNTISRLSVLVDNTRRFAESKELKPRLVGNDELAALDLVFHEMVGAARAARQREAELIEMKQQVMAMVSHDLRSPLTALQATLTMLNNGQYGSLSELGQQRVQTSDESLKRLIRMINDLLDLEKLEAGKMVLDLQVIPIVVLLTRSVEAVEQLATEKEVQIQYPEDTELEVKADADRLIQVLVNLLSNAIKYSPESGTISIECSATKSEVEVRVTDQGPGVPEDCRERIFERYKQVESSTAHKGKGGTGLGLAICKLIMEMHQGTIGVTSHAQGGSTFWFKIPRAELQVDEA